MLCHLEPQENFDILEQLAYEENQGTGTLKDYDILFCVAGYFGILHFQSKELDKAIEFARSCTPGKSAFQVVQVDGENRKVAAEQNSAGCLMVFKEFWNESRKYA